MKETIKHSTAFSHVADAVAEEASKPLVLDLNLEQAAKKCENAGITVATRRALV